MRKPWPEGAAFVVLSPYGMDMSSYSFGYVASWAEKPERLKTNLGEVQKVAGTLITAVAGEQPEQMGEWA
jgi:hypothetical protein